MSSAYSKRVDVFSWVIVSAFVALTSTLFLLFFSYYTSPLSSSYGYDAAFFQLVGAGLLDGYVPYRDFFDMKGPYLFFLEAIGQFIVRGRIGAFILQWISLFASLILVFKTMKQSGRRWWVLWGIAVSIICLFPLSFTLEGGNLTEELSLPFNLAVLFIVVRFFSEYEKGSVCFGAGPSLLCGAIVGVIFFIRMTNAAFDLALLISVAIFMIMSAEVRQLLKAVAFALLGFIAALIPPCLFFWANGCLDEMWYCVIQFGFMYAGEMSFVDKLIFLFNGKLGIMLTMLLVPVISTIIVHPKSAWCWTTSLLCSMATGMAMAMGGNDYFHYATLAVPVLVLGCSIALSESRESGGAQWTRYASIALIATVIVVPQYEQFDLSLQYPKEEIQYHLKTSSDDSLQPYVTDIVELIPDSDRDSVFCYGNDRAWSRWYCMADLYPSIRFMDWQRHYLELEPAMKPELISVFSESPPKWLVVPSDRGALPDFILYIVDKQYVFEHENDKYALYHAIATGD